MYRKQSLLALAAIAATIAQPTAFSQESGRNEVAIQAIGSFVSSNDHNGVRQETTDSGGILGTYRFFFSTHHGVEGNYGYARNTLRYSGVSNALGVRTNNHEVSGAYVFRYPMRRWKPFALAGAAALVFDPADAGSIDSQTRGALVYGGGADFNLSRSVFIRAQYRGFLYTSPTYDIVGIPGLAIIDRLTHRAEPSVGFGFRF